MRVRPAPFDMGERKGHLAIGMRGVTHLRHQLPIIVLPPLNLAYVLDEESVDLIAGLLLYLPEGNVEVLLIGDD